MTPTDDQPTISVEQFAMELVNSLDEMIAEEVALIRKSKSRIEKIEHETTAIGLRMARLGLCDLAAAHGIKIEGGE